MWIALIITNNFFLIPSAMFNIIVFVYSPVFNDDEKTKRKTNCQYTIHPLCIKI